MSSAARLFYARKLYDVENTDGLFVKAMLENIRHHQKHCPEYAAILSRFGFSPDSVRTIDDLGKLPPIPTLFLKNHPLYSASLKHLILKSTTSGTSGKVSVVGFDWPSSWRGLGMILGTFFTHRLVSAHPTNYIVLGYQPAKRNKIGAAKTA